MRLNKKLVVFRDAVHHMALLKHQNALKKTNVSISKAVKTVAKKENEDPVGHVFEHVEDDKTCEPAGLMGTEKGVTAPDGCSELCASMAGCVAFAFSIKPFKQCEFFSECTLEDANKIRKYSVYAIMKDGEIEDRETCGTPPEYPSSKPKDFGHLKEPKAFVADDEVMYKCDRDTTIDGSK